MLNTRITGGVFSRNERLILSLIRKRGPMPRAALAQATGLSAQAITNLSRKLIENGFLAEEDVVRGKVGQPSTPLSLAPDGALFIGLKLGRRLAELALVDFAGQVKLHRQEIYPFPEPDRVLAFARHGIATFQSNLTQAARDRIAGLGIATPFRLWDWGVEMAAWQDHDLRAELAAELPFPVFLENDATTACGAELVFGQRPLPADFLHIYIAHFPGGGLVLDGKLRFGPQRNAAALGSILVPDGGQLLDRASVASLETRLGRSLHPDDSAWDVPERVEAEWAAQAGRALAFVSLAAASIVDLPLVVIDGAVPHATRTRLVEATRTALIDMPREGIDPPEVIEGSLGRNARVLGAAALPLSHFFQPDGQLG
ncbi:ROK family transcriptional regulator [Paracoccus sp. YLB-12]|uniref:ROK family transcriptional regulator n=1 Tax=Paracoccus maritimus TaxID=2933292 RepID=A0ABT2K8K0_9RHOB|nr:ROK family transcriptional regulator [Paracoccus sp. YLB-12]MCT4332860.1 ROK family transcriptional regulator [Paracoccus sp. YLB-12]